MTGEFFILLILGMLVFGLAMIPLYSLHQERKELEKKWSAELAKLEEEIVAWAEKLRKIEEAIENERPGS